MAGQQVQILDFIEEPNPYADALPKRTWLVRHSLGSLKEIESNQVMWRLRYSWYQMFGPNTSMFFQRMLENHELNRERHFAIYVSLCDHSNLALFKLKWQGKTIPDFEIYG